jgi:hypothetical protein
VLAIAIIFLLFLKPYSHGITSVQSAYPAPDSPVLTPTPQISSPVFAYPPPSTPNVAIISTPEFKVNQDNTSLTMDAKSYATIMGVDFQEAKRRLLLQSDISELNLNLAEKEADKYGGLWIQHKPDFRVIVLFTRDGDVTIQKYIQNRPLANLVSVVTARSTLKELEDKRKLAVDIVGKTNIPYSSSINIPNNQVELYVQDPEALTKSLPGSYSQLSDNASVIKFKELSKEVTEIWGGEELSTCTSGFAVMDPSGIKGGYYCRALSRHASF